MSGDFSPITFFQRIPSWLLDHYFHERHGVLGEIDFDRIRIGRKGAEEIYQAFAELPEEKQAEIETECQDIESMANPEGIIALIEEARDVHGNADFAEAIDDLTDDFRDKAMWAFLEYPDYWPGAVSILYAENVREVFWKKRNDLPHVFAHLESQDIRQLEHALSNYFFRKQRRGRHCKIDVYRKQGREYLFAYLSDFSRSDMEWDKTFTPRSRIPTFKIIFVYTKTEGSLDIHAPKNTKHTDRLQQLFTTTILKLDETLDKFAGDDRVYELDVLVDRNFEFQNLMNYGIQSVLVRSLRLPLIGTNQRITVEIGAQDEQKVMHDRIDALNLPPFHVTQAIIKVTFFKPEPGTRKQTHTFTISHPASCSLRHKGRDSVIRDMLITSGIELTERENATEDSAA